MRVDQSPRRPLWFQKTDREGGTGTRGDAPDRPKRIRCPKCKWTPGKHDLWACVCGHSWNTFDTRGLCPACDAQWRDTQCLKCHEFSLHLEWYEDDPGA